MQETGERENYFIKFLIMKNLKSFKDFTIWAYFRLFLMTPFILILIILHFTQLFFYYWTWVFSYIANKINELWDKMVETDSVRKFIHWDYK